MPDKLGNPLRRLLRDTQVKSEGNHVYIVRVLSETLPIKLQVLHAESSIQFVLPEGKSLGLILYFDKEVEMVVSTQKHREKIEPIELFFQRKP